MPSVLDRSREAKQLACLSAGHQLCEVLPPWHFLLKEALTEPP